MCFKRRTWLTLKVWGLLVFLVMIAIVWWTDAYAAQSQDSINATLVEQMHWNARRLDAVEGKVDKINYVLGVLSAQLFIKIIELWHARTGSGSPHPPKLLERRSFNRHDRNDDDD